MSKFMLVLAALGASLLTGWFTLGEFNAVVWISVGVAGFAASKLMLANLMPVGHGLNGKRHIIGMPIVLFVGYLIILILALLIGLANDALLLPVTNANFRVIGLSICYGWAAALIDWYLFSYGDTYYASEYQARVILKEREASKEETETVISGLRRKGFLAPLPKDKKK